MHWYRTLLRSWGKGVTDDGQVNQGWHNLDQKDSEFPVGTEALFGQPIIKVSQFAGKSSGGGGNLTLVTPDTCANLTELGMETLIRSDDVVIEERTVGNEAVSDRHSSMYTDVHE
jgi:hypothetical protein